MKLVSRDWMEKAGEDLAATEKLANDPLVTGVASFHAQQCIEKSFKAKQGCRYPARMILFGCML